jgi:hypothetical protein
LFNKQDIEVLLWSKSMARATLFFLIALALALAIPACGPGADNANDGHSHGNAAGLKLTLNDGQKWKSDDHTRESMKGIADALDAEKREDVAGINALGKDLNTRLQELVLGCTMTGPEHEQLHVFLNEFMPAVERMVNAQDADLAKEARQDVRHLVDEYKAYFE